MKTHVAFGEDAYQKRAVPLVPVKALIPYIYVLTNNSFIDFIKERQRERESKRRGREREKRVRGRERDQERSLSIYTHVPSSQLLGTLLFFCIEESEWVSSRFKRIGPAHSLRERRVGLSKGGLGMSDPAFSFPPFLMRSPSGTFHRRERVYK